MAIDRISKAANIDDLADSVLSEVDDFMVSVKEMQRRKVASNVELVIQALKKIDNDIREKYDGVTTVIEKRVSTIKDGKDGQNGANGRDGKDGRPGRDGAVGPRGVDGLNGSNGRDGEDGVSVTDARIDFDGSLVISLSSGREINVGEVVAPDLADKIKVITNGGGTSQGVLDTLTSLQNQINVLVNLGAVNYVGTWNASTNTPTIVASTGDKGDYYVVSVAGSSSIDGQTLWGVGDWIIFNGAVWQRVDGGSTGNFTTLNASGVVTFDNLTASQAVFTNGSDQLVSNAITGTGNVVMSTSPTLVTPALGTPASGVVTNLTGTASININGTVGATTANTGAFTTLTTSSTVTHNGGTANGVAYLNGSKVLTTGTALVFDGTNLGIGNSSPATKIDIDNAAAYAYGLTFQVSGQTARKYQLGMATGGVFALYDTAAAAQRLVVDTSGNLGLGFTPNNWGGGYKAIQIATTGRTFAGSGSGSGDLTLAFNAYFDSVAARWGYVYTGDPATRYSTNSGQHIWFNAPSGVANSATITTGVVYIVAGLGTSTLAQWQAFFSALTVLPTVGQLITATATGTLVGGGTVTQTITFTQPMTLNASGQLSLGTTLVGGDLTVYEDASAATKVARFVQANSSAGTLGAVEIVSAVTGGSALDVGQWNNTSGSWIQRWYENANRGANDSISTTATFVAGINTDGNFGLGTSSPSARLSVTSGATGVQALFLHSSGTPTVAVGASTTNYNTQIGYNVTSEYGYIQATAATGVYDDIAINPLGGNLLVGLTSATGVAKLQVSGAIRTTGFTVATLPTGTVGMRTYVTDALAPSFSATVTGGGAVTIPVFYNGTNWIVA